MTTTTEGPLSEAQEAANTFVDQQADTSPEPERGLTTVLTDEEREQLRLITERQVSIDTRLDEVLTAADQARLERDAARSELAAVRQASQVDQEKTFALYAALAEFQAELPRIEKNLTAQVRSDKGAYSYGYADLAEVSNAILPKLGKCGLAWITLPRIDPRLNIFALRWMLTHKDGGTIWGDVPLSDPSRVAAQSFGSDLTYLRRYLLLSVTGCFPAGEDSSPPLVDDDGARSARGNRTGATSDAYGETAPSAPPAPRSQPAKAAPKGSGQRAAAAPQASSEGTQQGNNPIDAARKRAQQVVSAGHISWGEFADRYKRLVNDEDARWQNATPEQLNSFLDSLEAQLAATATALPTGEAEPPVGG